MAKSAPQRDLTILIPVYNEIGTLETIINKTLDIKGINFEIIIVDDFSTDGSRQFLEEWAKRNKLENVLVLFHSRNKGKGAGIKTALAEAAGKYFIIQDADLEYNPKDIEPIFKKAKKESAKAVYGSRFKGSIKNMATANYIANKLYNYLLVPLYGVHMTDMHTCYKMIDAGLLRDLKIKSNGFEYATEFVSKLLKRKVKIYEVPISFSGRSVQQGKKINMIDGINCFYDLVKYKFDKNI